MRPDFKPLVFIRPDLEFDARPVIAVDLSPWIETIIDAGRNRDAANMKRGTTKRYTDNPHGSAFFGESAYAVAMGLDPLRAVDWSQRPSGDDGIDFFRGTPYATDVKLCNWAFHPFLKEFTKASKAGDGCDPFAAQWYVLVAYLEPTDGGRHISLIVGHASRDEFMTAPLGDWGHGCRHSIGISRLRPGFPPPNEHMFDVLMKEEARFSGIKCAKPVTLASRLADLWPGVSVPLGRDAFDKFLRHH